ncbi:hypothetical protein MRX96_033323 [Rhipicephalus microplus]
MNFRYSSLWAPAEPQVVQSPLTSAENTLLVVNDNYFKLSDEGPQEKGGDVPAFCQFVVFLLLAAATVFIMCLLLFESAFKTPTSEDPSESTTSGYASFRLEILPGFRERGVITRPGTTDATMTIHTSSTRQRAQTKQSLDVEVETGVTTT